MTSAPADRPVDVLVIGAGIAAASLGYFLAPHARVVLLEREDQPGYHATGRSAALFMEGYGTTQVRALTRASRAFLEHPPAGFAAHPILTPRGALMVAAPGQERLLQEHWAVMQSVSPSGRLLDAAAVLALVPVMRPEQVLGGVFEPDAMDIDVHALHQGYLAGIRRHGGRIVCGAELAVLQRDEAATGDWRAETTSGQVFEAAVVVDAAGAWGDIVGALAAAAPLGLLPKRRAAFTFAPPHGLDVSRWPLFGGVDHTWYVKPDAGMLLGSPANEDPVEPQDVQPDELDIAIGVDRIETMTTLQVRRVERRWAGLRSFVADGDLVGGFDERRPGFFWLVAQGGYGIQTSAAMGQGCAALIRGLPLPDAMQRLGLTAGMLSPARLRNVPLSR